MTKQEILEAAAQIIRLKGYHAASMQAIAEAVGLQKASLYHHVASKQEILYELLDQGVTILIQRIQQVLDLPGTAPEKLHLAMATYLESLGEKRDLAAILLMEHRSLDPNLRLRHIERRDEFENLWKKLLLDGVEEGAFQCSDPDLTAKALLGVLNWTITWYRPDGELSATQIASYFGQIFLEGLGRR